MQPDRPQPVLDVRSAPVAFALRNIADRKARGRLRAAATVEAFGNEVAWTDADGWRYQLEAPPRVTISPKDNERAAATVDLRVWDATNALIFRDRIHAWDGFPVLVPDGTEHEENDELGGKVRVSNFRESPAEAARLDLAHTVRVVTKNGPWVKAKPGTVSTFYSGTADGYVESYGSATYSSVRAGTASLGVSNADTYVLVGQQISGGNYYADQLFLGFDTSSIPDDDTLSNAVLSLGAWLDLSTTDFTVEITAVDWGGTLTTADFVAGASLGAAIATFASAGYSDEAYNDFAQVGTGLQDAVSRTGTTYLIGASAKQRTNTAPTTDERIAFYSADNAGTTLDPKLVVTHAAATKPFRRSLLGVGF